MSKKKRHRSKLPRRSRSGAPGRCCLILIDEGPIRRAALAEYLKLEARGASLRAQIERFETVDRPAYERWEAATFGSLLTELREVRAALHQKLDLLEEIEEEMFWSGCSRLNAYRRVMKRLTDGPPEASESGADDFAEAEEEMGDADDPRLTGETGGLFGQSDLPPGLTAKDYDRMPRGAQREFRAFFESMAELYEIMTGNPAPTLEEALARDRARAGGHEFASHTAAKSGARANVPPAVDPVAARRKDLYRRIVRQLHPDAGGEFAARERELWHEAQAAHRDGDLERLEAVAARIELTHAGVSAQAPVGLLLRITRELQAALQSVRQQIERTKNHPAWRFQEKNERRGALESRRRRALDKQLAQSRNELGDATSRLDDLARRAAKPRKRKAAPRHGKAPSRPVQMDFF
ncbi:hypothetical protein BH20VER2_BH20VER2_17350 [soil metagenome]